MTNYPTLTSSPSERMDAANIDKIAATMETVNLPMRRRQHPNGTHFIVIQNPETGILTYRFNPVNAQQTAYVCISTFRRWPNRAR